MDGKCGPLANALSIFLSFDMKKNRISVLSLYNLCIDEVEAVRMIDEVFKSLRLQATPGS